MTERLRKAADAYRDHSLGCPECNDALRLRNLCELGEKLMKEFYDALIEAARTERGDGKDKS